MTPATQAAYRKLAAHFYATQLKGEQPTPKRISDALKAVGSDYRPAYWRRLRNALAFDQREKGYSDAAARIDATKNPVTRNGASEGVKPKQARVKRVTEADEQKLFKHFTERNDAEVTAALYVAKHTGARPAEMKGIEIRDGKVYIPPAKVNADGTRGAERLVELPPQVVHAISHAVKHLQGEMGPVQDRIRAAGKKLWPQRKAVPSLYSFRHQLGSDLKASGLDRREVAYLMGHQSTESVDRYGNAKTARGGRVLPKPAAGADLGHIRVDHKQPPAAPAGPGQTSDVPRSPAALAAKIAGSEGLKTSTDGLSRSIGKAKERQGLRKGGGLELGE